MKTSEPLSPAARRLLELGSSVEPPTAEQCERMDRSLAPLFGAGRSAPLADPPRAGSERGVAEAGALLGRPREKLGVLSRSVQHRLALGSTKLVLAVGALAATAGASFWLGRVWTPPAEPRAMNASFVPPDPDALVRSAALTASELAAPSPASSTQEASSTRETGVAGDAAPMASSAVGGGVRSRHGAPGKPRPAAGLAAEVERMARVEAALRQGRSARALEYLDQGKAEHLVEQAEALRAIAGCQSGLESSAVGAEEVLQRWPASAFQSRIRDACGL